MNTLCGTILCPAFSCRCGGTGRRAGMRILCLTAYGFESCHRHQVQGCALLMLELRIPNKEYKRPPKTDGVCVALGEGQNAYLTDVTKSVRQIIKRQTHNMEDCQSGRMERSRKPSMGNTHPWVQIPHPPPKCIWGRI